MRHKRMKGGISALAVVFVIAGLLVSVLGYRQFQRLTTAPTWVAADDLEAGQVLSARLLREARSGEAEASVRDPRALVGKRLTVDKAEGEPFFPTDLKRPPKKWLADVVPEGRVLTTLTLYEPDIPPDQIRMGDRLDVVVGRPSGQPVLVARNALLMGVGERSGGKPEKQGRSLLTELAAPPAKKKDKQGLPLVLAVFPKQAFNLAQLTPEHRVSLVLHGSAEVKQGRLLNIQPPPTHRKVELMTGLERKEVLVKRLN